MVRIDADALVNGTRFERIRLSPFLFLICLSIHLPIYLIIYSFIYLFISFDRQINNEEIGSDINVTSVWKQGLSFLISSLFLVK